MAEPPATSSKLPQAPEPAPPRCANCGSELRGPYCHQCGQPTRHVIRHLPGLVHDGLDVLFDIDGRIMRTLPALYLRPGYLANEYFAGRRMRYIPPFRLMFFLSLLAFLVLQFNVNLGQPVVNVNLQPGAMKGDTPAEVRANLRKAEQAIQKERADPDLPSFVRKQLDTADRAARASANARLRELGAAPLADAAAPGSVAAARAASAPARPASVPAPASTSSPTATAALAQAVHIDWLPDFANQRLREGVAHARANWTAYESGSAQTRLEMSRRIANEALSVLPQALFVMLPLFALLLKVLYLFKRRLYIEHLMVAMYSHAFIYLSLLLWGLDKLLVKVAPAWAGMALLWLGVGIWLWIPVYLLLMQKRVYRQGWVMTLCKYALVGICYSVLLSLAVACALVIGFAS